MPIVFEEVTGEILPDRGAPETDEGREGSRGDDLADTVRREIHLMSERDRRLRAD
jgi:hypothetical protein